MGILVDGDLIGIVQNLSVSDAINLRSSFGLVYSRREELQKLPP
ncbi:hypothetical protein D082_02370 [Synechocystis sp. PCC 6714]|nr:hypothetical protein D082_02370 [Synechocystis sp. PCC 6714]